MPFTFIETELSEGLFTIRLNRPDKLNSFNIKMGGEVQEALRKAKDDDEIRCVLLTGNGRAFCAGQDLAEAMAVSDDPDRELSEIVERTYNPIIMSLRTLEKPVICAVNGTAAGAGANIALACDIVVANQEAKFIQSFSAIGLIPDSGGTYILPRLIGYAKATALAFLGEPVMADEAVDMGMIWKAYPKEIYFEEAVTIGKKLAKMPTRGLGLTKKGFNEGFSNSLEKQMMLESKLQKEAGSTADYTEGVQAFLEKRKPEFTGK
ncbi:enoyl-CoA hydratase-related protein [Balneola sp. MJW-20]|uniref:enoyl-CoA hydratase-related protein n=1 Tax=Gracilimonas aurantiaca TaxID=3234185 RepID=UPI00346736EB